MRRFGIPEPEAAGWVVQFDMPFMISMPDSMVDSRLKSYMETTTAGADTTPVPYSPRLENPTSVGPLAHIPTETVDPVLVQLDHGFGQVRTLRRLRNVDVPFVLAGELRPCYGQSAFTSIQVEFGETASKWIDQHGDKAMEAAADLALDATNRLITEYRNRCDAFWAQPIGRDLVSAFRFYVNDGTTLRPRKLARPPGGPVRGLGSEPLLSGDRLKEVRAALWNPLDDPQPAREVFFMAMEHRARGRYRNAVIDCSVAFETFVSDYVQVHGEVAGWSHESIVDAFLRRPNGRWRSVTEVLGRLPSDPVNVDFCATSEYADWREHVANPRNALVHGEVREATRQMADQAIDASHEAIRKLQELKTYM